MLITDLTEEQLIGAIRNGGGHNERSLIIEAFSRMPYWGMNSLLIVPVNVDKNGDSITNVRGYRELIEKFTMNNQDYLKESIAKTPSHLLETILSFGGFFQYRNVIFIPTNINKKIIYNLFFDRIPSGMFTLILSPSTAPYQTWIEILMKEASYFANSYSHRCCFVIGTKLSHDDLTEKTLQIILNKFLISKLSPFMRDQQTGLPVSRWHDESKDELKKKIF